MSTERLLLVGCGILHSEVDLLIEKNRWPVDTLFLDSALHVDFGRLGQGLAGALARHREARTIVFYGTCHPLMDQMLAEAHTIRTRGQNCCDMLLGRARFDAALADGAYFLLEDWALRWEEIVIKTFNTSRLEIIRDIFRNDRTHLLALRTPCSGDFSAAAEAAGRMVDLPVRWLDVGLDHLETVLSEAITQKMRDAA